MGALANSPFALLDAHSSLHLVTDVVHEDNALCLALTCKALRDALGARFPACPRAGGGAVARLAARVTTDGVLDLSHARPQPPSYDDDGDDDARRGSAGWPICPRQVSSILTSGVIRS